MSATTQEAKIRLKIQGFVGQLHSWSNVAWGVAKSFLKAGNDVHLFPTDGIEHIPSVLKNNIVGYTELNKPQIVYGKRPEGNYDCQFTYTCMINFGRYLSNGNKNRFGYWCYEWSILPDGFAKHHIYCDKLLTPSLFAKKVFTDAKIPEDKIVVIPHGIDIDQYKNTTTIDLKTNKRFKILVNLAQLHLRKNITGLLDAYGKAFTKRDDVCLILKAKDKPVIQQFDVSLKSCLLHFYGKYPQHAEVKIFSDYLEDISVLYRSVDATFTMAHCEGFYFPGLESIASGKIAIAPKHGGQLDFLIDNAGHESNALLVDGQETFANPKSMYWQPRQNAMWFNPSIDDAVDKLRYAYNNFETLNRNIDSMRQQVYEKYGWDTIAGQILNLCN